MSRASCWCVADVPEPAAAVPTACGVSRLQWSPRQEVPLWDIGSCVLEDGQILIPAEEEVPTYTHIQQLNV